MKKILSLLIAVCMLFCLTACNGANGGNSASKSDFSSSFSSEQPSENSSNVNSSSDNASSIGSSQANNSSVSEPSYPTQPTKNAELPTIYLAGDSTVKTYTETQYIGGWGQYLWGYLDATKINVDNRSNGGRSTRSFINEGSLELITSSIKSGDYLFIQFGHNDDDTSFNAENKVDRQVPLGTADENGIFPTTPGTKVTTAALPDFYNGAKADATLAKIKKYGDAYYSYDCGGTFKWYLKQYITAARAKGATPVLFTPVSRVKFNNGKIIGGAGRFGTNFEYVQAVRQVANELDCLLIDLHAETIKILEAATVSDANYLMALKPNTLVGAWPNGYDEAYDNTAAGYTGIEGTHYNKFGAFITAATVAEKLYGFANANTVVNTTEKISFGNAIKTTPIAFVKPSTKLATDKLTAINALYSTMKIIAE